MDEQVRQKVKRDGLLSVAVAGGLATALLIPTSPWRFASALFVLLGVVALGLMLEIRDRRRNVVTPARTMLLLAFRFAGLILGAVACLVFSGSMPDGLAFLISMQVGMFGAAALTALWS